MRKQLIVLGLILPAAGMAFLPAIDGDFLFDDLSILSAVITWRCGSRSITWYTLRQRGEFFRRSPIEGTSSPRQDDAMFPVVEFEMPGSAGSRKTIISLLAIVLSTVLAYSNTFHATFHFDDFSSIVRNAALRDLRNQWPPSGTGAWASSRSRSTTGWEGWTSSAITSSTSSFMFACL